MRVARSVLSAFLSMALVVGMVPDCAYAKVAARALHLGTSQASPSGAGDAQQASQDDVASSGEPAPADTGEAGDVAAPGEVADGDAELQSAAPEEGFSYQQASGGVEVTGYAGDATELSIPEELGGSKVVGIANSALSGHTSLRSVEVPGSVGTLGAHSFDGCTSLASVRLSEGVRRLGALAFQGCSSLASVELPASLESTEGEAPWGAGPFEGSGLASARLAPGSTRVAAGAFRGCSSLAGVDLPASVSFVDNDAFDGCSSLSSVTLPEGLRGLGSRVFSGCPLASVTVPASLESTGGWFRGDGPFAGSGLSSARLAEGSVRVATGLFGGCGRLASVEVPGTVTSVGDRAFQGCTSLASLSLPASVTSIADTAFEGCDALTISCPRGSFAYSWAMEHGMGVAASDGTHALLDPAACSYSARRLDDGLVELTVRWGLAEPSADVSVGAVTLGVPVSTDVREVRVDGAAADWSLSGRKLYVPTGAPSGSVEVLCEVPAGEASSPSYASVALRSGGAPASEVVGSVADLSSPLSISVPEVTASGTFSVRGNAPAGSRVELRVGGVPAGSATASASGAYEAEVSVSSPVEGWEYAVSASCGGSSARGTVLFDPSSAGVTSFVMRYDGRDHDLLGADSVTLTFLLSSYHGEHPFRFEVAFDVPPERIEVARVVSVKGTERKCMDLAWDGSAGLWVAEGWFDPSDHDYVPGSLSVSYKVRPREVADGLPAPGAAPAPTAARPAGWEDVTVTPERLPDGSVRYTYHSPTLFGDGDGPATITVTRREAEEARQAGAPATVEEAIEQGYEPVGRTYLPVARGKVIGSPGMVGGPYKTGDGSSCYMRASDGPGGVTNVDLVMFGAGTGLQAWEDYCVSKEYLDAVKEAMGRLGPLGRTVGIASVISSAVSSGVQVVRYNHIRDVIGHMDLSDEERASLNRRMDLAEALGAVNIGLSIACVIGAPFELGVVLGIFGLVNSFAIGWIDMSIIWDLLWYERRGSRSAARIDPSGSVRDADTGAPIPGARVTLWCRPTPDADPEPWDASPYGQGNPLSADARGSFSRDVPEGWRQVRVEAEGYRPVFSKWVRVSSGEEPDLSLSLGPLSPSAWVGPHAASTPASSPDPPAGAGRAA